MFGSLSRAFLCWRRDAEVWFSLAFLCGSSALNSASLMHQHASRVRSLSSHTDSNGRLRPFGTAHAHAASVRQAAGV